MPPGAGIEDHTRMRVKTRPVERQKPSILTSSFDKPLNGRIIRRMSAREKR